MIPHRIERTRNRHSSAVFKEETIVIRLAKNLSNRQEQAHIENLLNRMAKKVSKEVRKIPIDPFRPLFEGQDEVTIELPWGDPVRFTLTPGLRTKATKGPNSWRVTVSHRIRKATLHRTLWNLLAESALPTIDTLVRRTNEETLKVSVRSVRMRFAKTQWGSCSRSGNIMLNSSLLCVSPELLEYVIIHELAHCIHANHSKKYWSCVESAFPAYQNARKKLRNFRITSL